jgi:serine/threonine-protein kinase
MSDDPRVQKLLDELFDRQTTPEEVCGSCAELLPVVRERWRQICRARAELDALLPATPAGGLPTLPPEGPTLPTVAGYEVEAVLGRGGMGVVFRARHLRLNRLVALKMALAGAYAGPHERERFRREAEAVAALRHPNVVQVYDVGEADGLPYFTMELLEGGSLADQLTGAPRPARQAAQLVATLTAAVHAANQCGIVHRDLKPANILLAADGTPKITDFGLARRLDHPGRLTWTGTPLGTPSYMAPEQARGNVHAIGPATDVYALGAILYELLTGRPPCLGETAAETVLQVIHQEPVPPARLNAKVPRDLETICLKCLSKEPGRRYASARQLGDDLGRFLRGEPVAARPIGAAERLQKWVRRRPAVAALLAVAVLLAVAGGAGAWLVARQQADAQAHQDQTDEKVRGALGHARGLLEEGWQAADLAKLAAAGAEAKRAVDVAHSGGASAPVLQEADAFLKEAGARRARAEKTRALLDAILDAAFPPEKVVAARDDQGRPGPPARQPLDDQYATAFRRWGLDVDATAEAEVVARLLAEPDVVVQEVIAGLDLWLLARQRDRRPEADWRRLYRVADRLDGSARHRRLRALLVGELPPRWEGVAGLVGPVPSWPALWDLARGERWQQVRRLRQEIDARTAPVGTVVLLSHVCRAVGDAVGAEEVLGQALAHRPGQVLLLYAQGKLWEQQGRAGVARAIEFYRAARAQRPRLGIALSEALIYTDRGNEAERILLELVRDRPQLPELHVCLGVALDAQHKDGAAEAAFRKAVELQPDSAALHNNLGICLERQRQHAAAEAAYRKAIELRPDFAAAHGNLGMTLGNQRNYPAAEAALGKAIDLNPRSAVLQYDFGTILRLQQRYAAAEAAYRKAIELRPDFAWAFNELGSVLMSQRKDAAAEAAFRRAIDLQPDYALAYYNLAVWQTTRRPPAVAEASYRKAIDLQPDLAVAHHGLGAVLIPQGRFGEALASVQRAYELLPRTDPGRERVRSLLVVCERFVALDARLGAILRGTEKPAGAVEQIELARVCTFKQLHAAAARFHAEAFAARPELAAAVTAGARFSAARAAVLAGCGQGRDADRLDPEARARWRRQALDWLRQDLTWWDGALAGGDAQAIAHAREWLPRWRTDGTLDGVRARDGLARLPDAERAQWQQLWSDVDALLRRAGAVD